MGKTNTASKIESIRQETLEEEVEKLRRRIELSPTPAFIMGYCAARDSTFDEVVSYIHSQIAPKTEHPTEVKIDPRKLSLSGYFLEYDRQIQTRTGEIAMFKVRGFENLHALLPENGIAWRAAHDYDQNVCENQAATFQGLDKKVIVVTQINPESGREKYKRALHSALRSQFKSFIYEFEE